MTTRSRRAEPRVYPETLRDDFRRFTRLAAWGKSGRWRLENTTLVLRQKRKSQSRPERTSGHAHVLGLRIVLTCGCDPADARATLLHEMAHIASPINDSHSDRWRGIYTDAVREATGQDIPLLDSGATWVLDQAVATLFRELEQE